MHLQKLSVTNYRCLESLEDVPFHELTVFIGANGVGKTALLRAIEILLTSATPFANEYRRLPDNSHVPRILLKATFKLDPQDTLPAEFRSADGQTFHMTKSFSGKTIHCQVERLGFADPRLNDFAAKSVEEQKAAFREAGLPEAGTKPDRLARLQAALANGTIAQHRMLVDVSFDAIEAHLPRFELVASSDYQRPDDMITRTLQGVIRATLYPRDSEGNETLRTELVAMETLLQQQLQLKVDEMEAEIRRTLPRLRSAKVVPQVDFSKGVAKHPLMVDLGDGHELVENLGDGDRKKLWMALLEWDRRTRAETGEGNVLRAYDEPDVNLDYEAERTLFSNVFDAVYTPMSRTQAVVCTHAVTMIDRVAARSLNLLRADALGKRRVEFLQVTDDDDVREFLSDVGRSMGVTNSALFYERAFLLVEGESEEAALPLLYRSVHNRTLVEDGIVLINFGGIGNWRPILKVLQKNKQEVTVMLLDTDAKLAAGDAKLSAANLASIGYSATFQLHQCVHIGVKEFEDAFGTTDIVAVLNQHYPRADGQPWAVPMIDALRQPGIKFSAELVRLVKTTCTTGAPPVSKPVLARRLAERCTTPAQVPQAIRDAFAKARQCSAAIPAPPVPILESPPPAPGA